MFARANQDYKVAAASAAPQRPTLPTSTNSSQNGDIRAQLKWPSSTSTAATSLSARMAQPQFPSPLDNRPLNMSNSAGVRGPSTDAAGGSTNRPLATLYAKSDSFKTDKSNFVDLTGADTSFSRSQDAVFFNEDDFSDDDDLSLDFEAQQPLPPPPKAVSLPKENVPPPAAPSQQEVAIPWSSSPASHLLAANAARNANIASSSGSSSALKRDSSGDGDSFDVPAQKKPKKRVLPSKWKPEVEVEVEDNDLYPAIVKTPASKSKFTWDATASAIKEQKKMLKSQKNSRQEMHALRDAMDGSDGNQASKSVAISLSSEQEHVLDMVVNKNKSVFFTGPAGTGKSVLMRAIITELKKKYARDQERIAVTASTGLAACNIGGITLHSFSGIGLGKEDASALVKKVRRNPKAKNRWLRTKCLIIDEISMVDGDLFDKLSQIGRTIRNNGRPWGGIQLIITGDFFQLPPVPDYEKRESKFCFDATTWSTSIDHTIGLTQVFRQRDPEFARMLNEMRIGKISQSTVDAFKALSRPLNFDDGVDLAELFPTRNQVESSNLKRLNALRGKVFRYDAMDTGDPQIRDKLLANMMAPKAIDLKVGAQVMLIKNLDESLVNGSLGKVIGFSDEKTFDMSNGGEDDGIDDSMAKAKRKLLQTYGHNETGSTSSGQQFPVVQFISTGGFPRVILCQPEEWKVELPNGDIQAKRTQLPLILAWALSIHKAQGQTLERVTVNLGKVFEKGQAYVALSRATSQHGLQVVGFEKSKVMAHPRVVDFYGKLYSAADALKKRPTTISDFIANRRGAAPAPKPRAATTLDDEEEAMASYGF